MNMKTLQFSFPFDLISQSNQMYTSNGGVVFYNGFNAKSEPCGLDLRSGIFTAPVDGAYLISFIGMKVSVDWR